MKTNLLLANVRVASPCSARWGHMIGDERSRFCTECQKHVFNLSRMTTEEATALIRQKEGKLCARFYRRADGMILTSDCPMGAGQVWRRLRVLFQAGAALLVVTLTVPLVVDAAGRDEVPRARGRVTQAWNEAVVTIKTWLGHPPPSRMVMGDICVVPPPRPSQPPVAATRK